MKANAEIKLKDDKSAYSRAVGGLAALLLTILIGTMIYWSVSGAIDVQGAGATSHNNTDTMAVTVFTLLPLVSLVVVAAIILAVIMGFGGKTT